MDEIKTLGFDWAYRFYRGKVQSEKILMGVPYYTRGLSDGNNLRISRRIIRAQNVINYRRKR